jgi:hypothetical protein
MDKPDDLATFVAKTGCNSAMTLQEQLNALLDYRPLADRCQEVLAADYDVLLDDYAMHAVRGLVCEMMHRQFRHDRDACLKAMDAMVGMVGPGSEA